MNTSGLLQSLLILQVTRSVHDSSNWLKIEPVYFLNVISSKVLTKTLHSVTAKYTFWSPS